MRPLQIGIGSCFLSFESPLPAESPLRIEINVEVFLTRNFSSFLPLSFALSQRHRETASLLELLDVANP